MARRRSLSPFNLAFLDIMFCGFGAVVLLVLLLNSRMVRTRNERYQDLRAEVSRLEQEVSAARGYLEEQQQRLREGEENLARTRKAVQTGQALAGTLQEAIDAGSSEGARLARAIDSLAASLKDLEGKRNSTGPPEPRARGNRARFFQGEDNRQYLTGLKLGGRRVLILLDGSASMLDTSVVNVIRLRNMPPARQLQADKWLRARRTVGWLTANLPPDSSLQVMLFNETCRSLFKAGNWLSVRDKAVGVMLSRLENMVPQGGTSLARAFLAAAALRPRPDNIILVTDGLPTQGTDKPRSRMVSGAERMRFFQQALERVPAGIPINTILFPMEGDPLAAVSFWELAIRSHGSLLTPTSDWP